MENNQSAHPQHSMPDQGFGQVTSPLTSPAETSSIPITGEGSDEQLHSSSDCEEDDDGEQRDNGDVAGDSATERHMVAQAERITLQARISTSQRRSKSKVWEEFTAVRRDGKTQYAVCKHCKSTLSGSTTGGTIHLRRHLKTCPARPATGRSKQRRSSSHPADPPTQKNSNFDGDRSLELLTKALVSNLCPFSLVNSEKFREFLAGICPIYDMATQASISEKFLSIFRNEKLKLEEAISLAPGGVFLTVARWGLESKYFICVTAHFIDREWNMVRKIIRCSFVGVEKRIEDEDASMFADAQSLENKIVWNPAKEEDLWDEESEEEKDKEADAGKVVKAIAENWRLEEKLSGILLATSISDTTISGLKHNLTERNDFLVRHKLLSLPCIIGSLHDLFECTKGGVKDHGKDWFKYMTLSSQRIEKYKKILSQLQVNRPSFGSHKWHVTFHVLEAALRFNEAWPNPEQMDSKDCRFESYIKQRLETVQNFCEVARRVYRTIEAVSSVHNATLNLHFHAIWSLKIDLMSLSRKANMDKAFNIKDMNEKFDNLWKKWYLWLCLGVALDPRYKIRFLDTCFKQACSGDGKRYILEVLGKIYELFIRYTNHAVQHSADERLMDDDSDCGQLGSHGSVPVHETRQNNIEQSARVNLAELNGYLEGDCIPESVSFDVLKWWKDNAFTYPTLARLARHILAIPVCAVSAESAFDRSDKRVGLFNQQLSPEVVEALICTQDWIKSSETNGQVSANRNMPA